MDTPICDFLTEYAKREALRLHMPGHKGVGEGLEKLDLTEIDGADSLYHSEGIIERSRLNASQIFGADTYYVTEGSSQSIRAMLYLVATSCGGNKILAARNAHKSFVSGAALLGLDVEWLYQSEPGYLSCDIKISRLEEAIEKHKPTAVYITTPDYLGNTLDVAAISKICKKHGVLLLVDNAHGGYFKFLPLSKHPIDLGADMCCDSAHKTLPALTGAAYLHVNSALGIEKRMALSALSLFGSTSPSYLILSSLDKLNPYLAENFREELKDFLPYVEKAKTSIKSFGYKLVGSEPLKITVEAKAYGYTGIELSELLNKNGIVSEFYDADYLVLMLTPQTGEEGLERLVNVFSKITAKTPIKELPPQPFVPHRAMSIREATLKNKEILPLERCRGKVLAEVSVSCPPAVPILVCGEVIDERAIEYFKYYRIKSLSVVK